MTALDIFLALIFIVVAGFCGAGCMAIWMILND
jgi:hypothetical protein